MTKRNKGKGHQRAKRNHQGHTIVNSDSSSKEAIKALKTHERRPVNHVFWGSGDAIPSAGGATFSKPINNGDPEDIVNTAIDDDSPTGGFREDSQQINDKLEAFDNKLGLSIENSEYRAQSKLDTLRSELIEKIAEAKHSTLVWLVTTLIAAAGICVSAYFTTKNSIETELADFERSIEKSTETRLSNFEYRMENKVEKRVLSLENQKKKQESGN